MGDIDEQAPAAIEPGAAGAPEGAVAEPSADEIAELYKATGVKAPVPTGKPKGRPKADAGGDKKTAKQDDASGGAGKGQADDDGKGKSKAASASDSDGADGDDADSKGKKVSSKSGKDGEEDSKVSGDGDEDAEGVSGSKSKDNGKTPKSGEDDADEESDGAGEEDGKSSDASEEGKRPGKSNPEVEKRFQKLTGDVKERDQVIADLTKQLQEKENLVAQTKISQEDPEYTVEDFRKVQDKDGNIIDLDPERAELAWRRWKDGYDQRAEQRQAARNHAAAQAERESEVTRSLMTKSVAAYDTLAGLMDEYPELVSTSGKFDKDFADEAMPIIQDSIEYAPGTQPGNPEGNLPVILGLRVDPKKILTALKNIGSKKRNLPLNGVNDNVEPRSNVSVPHSRSSDPNVHAANELYKELGIKKRI